MLMDTMPFWIEKKRKEKEKEKKFKSKKKTFNKIPINFIEKSYK